MISILSLLLVSASTKLVLTCPEQIETQQEIVSKVDGWHISKESPNRYDREELHDQSTSTKNKGGRLIGFSSGPPEKMEVLVPDGYKKLKAKHRGGISTWTLTKSAGVYFMCGYQDTTIMLSRELPEGYGKCFIQYDGTSYTQTAWCEK